MEEGLLMYAVLPIPDTFLLHEYIMILYLLFLTSSSMKRCPL